MRVTTWLASMVRYVPICSLNLWVGALTSRHKEVTCLRSRSGYRFGSVQTMQGPRCVGYTDPGGDGDLSHGKCCRGAEVDEMASGSEGH